MGTENQVFSAIAMTSDLTQLPMARYVGDKDNTDKRILILGVAQKNTL